MHDAAIYMEFSMIMLRGALGVVRLGFALDLCAIRSKTKRGHVFADLCNGDLAANSKDI